MRPIIKVKKAGKIRIRYNQVSHLTQDTTWEINKNIRNKSQGVRPFPAGEYKAAMKGRENMTNTKHK